MVDLIVTVVAVVLAVLAVVSTGILVFFPNDEAKPELWSPAKVAQVEAEVLFSDPRTWGEEVKPAKPTPPKGRGAASDPPPAGPYCAGDECPGPHTWIRVLGSAKVVKTRCDYVPPHLYL